ncbi:phosphatase PAP2 family protein [Mycolicibacterium brisbanense]|uniref:phosphatase PAP2 family protein n=1 Tax=Mycolicibacterium brisbanense TaxID=146020 RepID=UPI0007A00AD4|nr:phosphatase PAP2 family protein [Mycolicibacterium brisbanense]MCV7161827.1 phosphatase PAP2 family protein [Mycolicibacterium brisbanense]
MNTRTGWLIASALIAVAVYALMWMGYGLHWAWLAAFDDAGLTVPYRYGASHPAWVTGWDVFCTVLSPVTFRIVALVVIAVAVVRRQLRIVLFLLLSVELSALLTELAKNLADRPRPVTALAYAPSTSFPSGHALGVMVGVLALLAVAWPLLRAPLRTWLAVVGAVVIVAIGVGRVVLNVHHPSDVVAGWALGYAYFVVCWLAVRPYPAVTEVDGTPAAPGIAR